MKLAQISLTIPEAAYVTKALARDIDREIDAKVVRSSGGKGRRKVAGDALVYLRAIGPIRSELTPALRARIRRAVSGAVARGESIAQIEGLHIPVEALGREVMHDVAELKRLEAMVEIDPEVFGGEPVLQGTRLPVRIIAELVEQGAPYDELESEFDITPDQIEAAVTYDRVAPRRGRPRTERHGFKVHVPPDR